MFICSLELHFLGGLSRGTYDEHTHTHYQLGINPRTSSQTNTYTSGESLRGYFRRPIKLRPARRRVGTRLGGGRCERSGISSSRDRDARKAILALKSRARLRCFADLSPTSPLRRPLVPILQCLQNLGCLWSMRQGLKFVLPTRTEMSVPYSDLRWCTWIATATVTNKPRSKTPRVKKYL